MTASYTHSLKRLQLLLDNNGQSHIQGGLKGVEKESLRISADGNIAQTPHPAVFGSALTHPHITTDYSEALLEFITPPFADVKETLAYLHNIHQFVYDHLDQEMLLASSMPCGIDGDESIPIAQYGTSNIGRMKHIYRRGLWHRYGRTMQAIAGIHFNYSVPEILWTKLHQLEHSELTLDEYVADAYFGMIRNIQRQGWLILYLFGASPAICKNFFKSRPYLLSDFEEFDAGTVFHPYATSLRMSDIGYKSKNQAALKIDYNSLTGYVSSLSKAITTPFPDYEKIGVKVDGDYKQLNSNILQIENEFYSTVRPKQIAYSGEKPTLALKRRGVRYLELRSLDLDLTSPVGIGSQTAYFVEAFLLTCLFQDSPHSDKETWFTNNQNQLTVAYEGRRPGLTLKKGVQTIALKDWANEICDMMLPICAILDAGDANKPYTQALTAQKKVIDNPELTPSAQILQKMTADHQAFTPFAVELSIEHANYFRQQKLNAELDKAFLQMAAASHQKQKEIESSDKLSFDEFLELYFSQR